MTVSHVLTAGSPSPSISSDEVLLISELRSRLNNAMPNGIPEDLDTDLNLVRWLRGYHANLDKIVNVFPIYVSSREAAGFLGADLPETYFEMPSIKQFLPFIASSRLGDSVWSEEHNAFLFVERAWSQPKEFIKTLKTSDYLLHCFGYSELLLQLILKREREQLARENSKGRGPVQFIVIFDLATVNITDYLNPMSGYMKLWQLRSDLWQDWYPDVVQKIFLVNPPRLMSALWKLAKLFLNERNCRAIEILPNMAEMLKYLPRHLLPKEFCGDYVHRGVGDESGVSVRRKIISADHYRPYEHYKRKRVDRPKPNHKDIGPGELFRVPIYVKEGQSLLWDFTANGEVDFSVSKFKDELQMVYPRLRLVTNKLPEEGVLEHLEEAEYLLEFFNSSHYFNVKLDYAITLTD